MNNLLEINNLNKKFKEFSLKNINLKIPKGFILGFIGENGAGKTTTIKHILNLMKKDSGEINVLGKEISKNEREIKQEIGFVLEDTPFISELSGKDNKRIYSNFYKNWDEAYFQKLAKDFSLNLKQKVSNYSKGQKTKLAISLALAHNPKLLILDEPTSGLDPIFRNKFLDLLQEFILDGEKSVLFSTHLTTDLEKIADYICMIDNGRIVFNKEKDLLLENYRLIKGKKSDLDFWSEKAINIEKHEFGFEALVSSKQKLPEQRNIIVTESSSLEKIMQHLRSKKRSSLC